MMDLPENVPLFVPGAGLKVSLPGTKICNPLLERPVTRCLLLRSRQISTDPARNNLLIPVRM